MSKDTKLINSKRNTAKYLSDRHQERVKILRKISNGSLKPEEIDSIAGLNFNDLKQVAAITEDSLIALGGYNKEKSTPKYADDSVIGKKVYSNLFKNGYLDFLKGDTSTLVHKETGVELMNKVINQNNINFNRTTRKGMADFQDVYEGINNFANIMKHGGQVVSYDLETLGGTNARGHQQVDFITEFAAMVHDIGPDGITRINQEKSMATLAGFSEEEYNHVKNYIKSLEGKTPGQLSEKDNIYIHRLSLLSDPTFKYEQQKSNGFEFRVKHAEPDNVVNSVENALKGLEEYRTIGAKQEAWLQSQGISKSLKDYKYEYAQKVSDLVHGHVGLGDNAVSLAHNSFNFDDPMFGMTLGKNIEHGFGKGVDSLQAMRYMQEHLGIGAHLPEGFKTTNKYGLTTQDQLKTMFNINSTVGAHNAEEDATALFSIFNKTLNNKGETYLDFVQDKIRKVNANLTNLKNNVPIDGLTGRKPIFLMDKTAQKDWSMNKNGLSFSYNAIDGSYTTFDGFRIDKEGNVSKQNINGYGPKAGALYTHDIEEIKLNQKNWKEQFTNLGLPEEVTEKYYQQYSGLDKLYVMRSREYQDPAALAAKFGEGASVLEEPNTYVTILTNKGQIATSAGTLVGRVNEDGSAAWNNGALKSLNLQTVTTENGKIAIKNVTGDEAGKMLLDRSMIRTSVESAARTIRDMPYERASKMHNYAKSKQHRISATISEMISQNKVGDINTSEKLMRELTAVLGYKDIKTGKQMLRPETITKANILDQYTEALSPILDIMEDEFQNMGLKRVGNNKALKAKKDIIFNNVLTNVLEQMSGNTQTLSNSVPGIFTADELNKVDFLRGDLFPKLEAQMAGTNIANDNSKYVSLDLSKDTGLMNLFYNNQFKDLDLVRDSNAGFTALFNAYDTIGEDERFRGVWGNLSRKDLLKYQNERNLIELNYVMTDKIKSFVSDKRKTDTGFGLQFVRNIQDYSNVNNLSNMIRGYSSNDLKSMVSDVMITSNLDVMMADGTDSNLVNKIVNKYFMTFSSNELDKQIQGLTHNEQQWMKAQYGFSKRAAKNTVTDLLESIKGTNINLGIIGSGKDSKMFLKQGNKTQFIDMYQFVLNNGVINHRINDIDYASNFSYNVNGIISKSGRVKNLSSQDVLENIKITSNVEEALERTRGFASSALDAKRREDDIFDALVYRVKSNNSLLREVGAMKQNTNFSNTMKRSMYINTNPIVGILPELRKSGMISQLEKDYHVSADTSKGFNALIDKIEKGEIRPHEINQLLANEQNLYFHQYINPLLDAVNRQAEIGSIENVDLKDLIIKTLNPHTQDTKLAAGVMSVDDNAYAHGIAKFDKTGRSVSIQTENQILYEREQLAKDVEKYGLSKEVSVGGKLMTSAGDKYINHNGKYTSGLTMKYLQIDSNELKNLFVDDVEKVRRGESNRFSSFLENKFKGMNNLQEASKALADKVMSLSTYQQQSIMDARAHYVAFHKNNEQIINSKKQLIISHTENVEVINSTMNAKKLNFDIVGGEIHYNLGYEVKTNDILGIFGEGNIERSKYNGVFRGRFFDKDGNLVSEAELNKFVKAKKLKDNDEIIKAINNQFNFKYQVIKKYDDFGHKVANDASEKSTVDVMDVAFGTIDQSLESDLNKALGPNAIKDLKGRYLSRDYIEQYISPLLGDTDKGLINRMLDERFALSDALKAGWKQFDGVQQITSLESSKHESISMAATNIVEKILKDEELSKNANKHFKKIFNGKLAFGEDGTLITDNISSINTKVKNSRLQKILNDTDYVKDDAGNIIGHTGYSHVTQIHDWEGGTYSSNLDISKLKNERFDIEGKIDALNAKGILSKHEQEQLGKYIEQQANIDKKIGQLSTQKGIKFDNRANLNLNKSVWNNDSLSLAYDNFKDKSEFDKYFGHAMNSNGKVSEEFLGSSILDPVTSVMRERTLIGFGETKLSSLKGIDRKKYGYLLESYSEIDKKISVEKAEKLYSLQQGMRAIDFNNAKGELSKSKYNALVNGAKNEYNNFKELDLTKELLDLDIGGQGRTVTNAANNPYTQNLMLRTGLGGKEEYLAIARMPERHFEDNLIKTSHIKKLNQLQNVIKEINSGNLNDEDLKSKTNYARSLIGDIKVSQIHDVTSKYGLAGDLNASRLSQSFFGKASSITYNYTKAFGENTYEELKALNGHSFLDKAKFDNKSLLQHYSEGKAIDAVAFSIEAAENMGYFSSEMMNKAGAKTREEMIEKLSTKGDTFLATRFPRNQEASDKVVMGYLDPTLKGNQLKAVGHTGASMKMDHDGDEFGIGRLTNNKGDSFLTMESNSTDSFITSQKAMLMERAVNDNRYWDQTIRDRVSNVEGRIARSGSSIQDVAKKRIIDNKVYSAIMNSGESARYEGLLQDDFYKGLVDKAIGYKGDGDAHDENIEAIKSRFKGDQSRIQKAKQEYVDAYRYQLYKDEFIAKSSKNSIGESNVTNLKIKEAFMGTANKAADDFNYKSSLVYNMMYLTEEAAISSKSSIKGLDPDRAKQWNSHAKDLILGRGDAKDHISAMKNWTKEYAINDIDYNFYWNKSNTFRDIASEEINNGKNLTKKAFDNLMSDNSNKLKLQNRLTNDLVDTLASLSKVDNISEFFDYTSVGQSTVGVKKGITKPTILGNFENVTDMMYHAQKSSHSDLNSLMSFLNVDTTVKSTASGEPNIIDKIVSNTEELGEETSLGKQVLEGASDLFKGVKGSKIAMGAVGIAAGVMMLGYVGGRPRPADTQAMEEATNNDYQEQQGGLMDPGMMPMAMSGSQQGYVVNINARSDKGRNHAISAIQQAISSGTSSNVNVSMNINDNYGNINDRDIQKVIKDAL